MTHWHSAPDAEKQIGFSFSPTTHTNCCWRPQQYISLIEFFRQDRCHLWLFILAASQSDTDNTSASVASVPDKNALRLHCCCVIVQITPVASGRSSYGASTASVKDAGRKPVCICNSQCRVEALKQETAYKDLALLKRQQHGSLDRLLPMDDAVANAKLLRDTVTAPATTLTAAADKNYCLEKFYHQINGDLFEVTRRVPIAHHHAKDTKTEHAKHKALPTRKKSLTKQHSHPQLQLRKSDCSDSNAPKTAATTTNINTNKNGLRSSMEKPQPPPRTSSRPKSTTETDYINAPRKLNELLQIDTSNNTFDRSQRQRHSSRSMGGFERGNSAEFTGDKHSSIHQRHSSGPSELSMLKSDISEWLLNLPTKRGGGLDGKQHGTEKSGTLQLSQALKDELVQLLKRPLIFQNDLHSTDQPPKRLVKCKSFSKVQDTPLVVDMSSLQNDIVEWIKKSQQTQIAAKSVSKSSADEKSNFKTGKNEQYAVPPPPRKRHSFGHTENVTHTIPDWIPYPISRISEAGRARLGIAPISSIDISNNKKSDGIGEGNTRGERKLRHSSSEVVTPVTDTTKVMSSKTKFDKTLGQSTAKSDQISERSAMRRVDRPRCNQTQRSATVSDMTSSFQQHPKSPSAEHESSHSSSLAKCTDPMCPLIPICTDPNCCLNECYNTKRCSSLPRYSESKCTPDCYQYRSLPKCMDSKCLCRRSTYANIAKHNSLPKCVSGHRSGGVHHGSAALARGNSRSSLPRSSNRLRIHGSNGNGTKLVKSASAASLNSRRRRHKTVHFGENLLREVCQNRKLIAPLQGTPSSDKPSSSSMKSNVQMLYNFVEGVLSAWVDEDDETMRSGAESEPERGRALKPLYRCNRLRLQTISRVVNEAAQLRGTLKLGNSRYRHRHWRGTAKECNERFLRKVITICNYINRFIIHNSAFSIDPPFN